jgi:hypothetical protein
MIEKRNVIEQGRTPPGEGSRSCETDDMLEEDLQKRAAHEVGEAISQQAGQIVGHTAGLGQADFH